VEETLSADPLLSTVAGLFAMPAEQQALTERPRPQRQHRWAITRRPAFFGIGALLSFVVLVVLSGILDNGFVALGGLIGPALFGAAYLVQVRSSRRRIFRAPGMRAHSPGNSTY
jgi:hypothetical protein